MEPPLQPGLLALGNWKMFPGLLEMHSASQSWRWGKAPPLTENKLCFPVCEKKKKKKLFVDLSWKNTKAWFWQRTMPETGGELLLQPG